MDKTITDLIEQLRATLNVSDAEITDLIDTVRTEALSEAKATLKKMVLKNILERALLQTGEMSPSIASQSDWSRLTGPSLLPAESEKTLATETTSLSSTPPDLNGHHLSNQEDSSVPFIEAGLFMPAEHEPELQTRGYYLYGIVWDEADRSLTDLPAQGIEPNYPVYALPYQSIQAIVSQVALGEFGETALKINLQDKHWLESHLQAHQAIMEQVMETHTFIPMRFCTICPTESDVMDLLRRYHDEFLDMLSRLQGKQEWSVKTYCDRERLRQILPEISPKIRELQTELAKNANSAAYLLKKKLERVTADESEQLSRSYALQGYDRLVKLAESAVNLPLSHTEAIHELRPLVLNGAYLLAEDQVAPFQTEVVQLNHEYHGQGLCFELTGPRPPYNFVDLQINFPRPGDPLQLGD